MFTDLSWQNFPEELSEARAIQNKVETVLLTNKGEVRYDPDYGSNIRRYLFESANESTREAVIKLVKEALEDRVPEYIVSKIDVEFDLDNSVLKLNLKGRAITLQEDVDLSLEVGNG